ncbi:integrase, catalytic region, zinc finger, CCHC-type containing protein, partial [Tanacetum coccineum]
VSLKCALLPDDWIVDSGCTMHMTGNRRLFTSYKAYDGGHVVFGSNLKGKVIGRGNITHDSITITNVEHVSGLAFNLISVGYSQTSKAYIVLNKQTMRIEKSLNVTLDESLPKPKSSPSVEDDRIIEPVVQNPVRSPLLEANASDWWDLKPLLGDLSVKSLIDGIFCTHLPKITQSVFVGVCYSALWAIWRWRKKVWHAFDEDKAMDKVLSSHSMGSHIDIGPRKSNEDEHVQIDDLSNHLWLLYRWPLLSSFYAALNGHGSCKVASHLKDMPCSYSYRFR